MFELTWVHGIRYCKRSLAAESSLVQSRAAVPSVDSLLEGACCDARQLHGGNDDRSPGLLRHDVAIGVTHPAVEPRKNLEALPLLPRACCADGSQKAYRLIASLDIEPMIRPTFCSHGDGEATGVDAEPQQKRLNVSSEFLARRVV